MTIQQLETIAEKVVVLSLALDGMRVLTHEGSGLGEGEWLPVCNLAHEVRCDLTRQLGPEEPGEEGGE